MQFLPGKNCRMQQGSDGKSDIALCMIVRNEERFIHQCLMSVSDVVSQMVVVDTGSTDSTKEIATAAGAAVFELPWADDFSAARNFSIAQATSKWILVLDADEVIARRDAIALPGLVKTARVDGFKLKQRTYLQSANFVCASPNPRDYEEGREYSDCVNVDVIRLFRNDPRIRYRGKVHELVEPAFASHKLIHESAPVVLHHFGKVTDPAHVDRKKRMYLDLGRQKILDDPKDPHAQFELGIQYFELESYRESIAHFEAALKLNPTFDLALLYIAKAFHLTGRLDEAARHFQACLKLSPNDDRFLFDCANLMRDRGDVKAAAKLYERAIAANPQAALALFNLGVLLSNTGEHDSGLAWIGRAIALNPDNPTFHENLAKLPLPKSALPAAISMLERYIEKHADAIVCIAGLADMWFKTEQFERAAMLAERVIQLDAGNFGAWLTAARAAQSLANLETAQECYLSALGIKDDSLDCMMNLARIAETQGDKLRARSWYMRLLKSHPGQAQALKRLVSLQPAAVVDEETASALELACPDDLNDPQCLLLVGSVLERAGRVSRAAELYRSAARQKPEWSGTIHRKIEQLQLMPTHGGTRDVSIGL